MSQPTLAWATYSDATHQGNVRDHNEDRVLLQPWPDGTALLAVVADGMGGHRSGDVAATIAIETFAELLQQPLPPEQEQRYQLLREAYHQANQRILEQASTSFKLLDMGTTLVSAIITPDSYLYLHAGDCRFYHFDAHAQLIHQSKDHSVMQVLLDSGTITEAQVVHHPMRSVVNSCLGGRGDKAITIDPPWDEDDPPIYPYSAGDVLLLSSDGLHSMIGFEELQSLIKAYAQVPELLVEKSIEAALAAGGTDNISMLVIIPSI
jgi:PPM family protein phosphatase